MTAAAAAGARDAMPPPLPPRKKLTPSQMVLSPVMRKAMAFARRHGGKLTRHPGGFWAGPTFDESKGVFFGTTTVESLNSRLQGTYTQWKSNGMGQFPIEFTLNPEEAKP